MEFLFIHSYLRWPTYFYLLPSFLSHFLYWTSFLFLIFLWAYTAFQISKSHILLFHAFHLFRYQDLSLSVLQIVFIQALHPYQLSINKAQLLKNRYEIFLSSIKMTLFQTYLENFYLLKILRNAHSLFLV